MRRSAFASRWLARSLRRSLARAGVAVASLALTGALVFALVTLSDGVPRQLGRELRAYGANHVIVPRTTALRLVVGGYELGAVEEDRTLAEEDLRRVPAGLVDAVVPGLNLTVKVRGADTPATGYDLAALQGMNPSWRVAPGWPRTASDALVGASLAARHGLRAGDAVDVAAGERTARVEVAGIVETGAAEDDALLLPLAVAQELAARPGRISLALVRAPATTGGAGEVARALAAALPAAEVRTIAQVAHAETALLAKVRRLLAIVAAAVAAASAFTVSGTLGLVLLARRRELGLCLALGAPPRTIRAFLLAEAATAALAAGVAGCVLGAAAAEAIAMGAFGAPVPLGAPAAGLALASSLAIGLAAAVWPIRRALAASPCDTLRAP